MLNMINDTVVFQPAYGGGRTLSRRYRTYPHRVYGAAVALAGIDYGFSDVEGMFFRSTVQANAKVVSPYEVQVDITFGLRSQQFDKRTDAVINYNIFITQS